MSLFKKERLPASDANRAALPALHSVLLVDDEEGNLRVLDWMLSQRYRVLLARDGREALSRLEAMHPDEAPSVVISDLRMPRMSGIELLARVRELFPATIRMIVTGYVDVGATIDAVNQAGVDKFVVKPCDSNELMATVAQAIEVFEQRQQHERQFAALQARLADCEQALARSRRDGDGDGGVGNALAPPPERPSEGGLSRSTQDLS
jgi:two-component system, cell cycle response regulator